MFNVVNGKLEKMQRHMADVANLDVSGCGKYVAVSTLGGCVFVYHFIDFCFEVDFFFLQCAEFPFFQVIPLAS